MSTISRMLGDDHSSCDELFAQAEAAVSQGQWDDAGRRFADFRAALARHFTAEEQTLFPAFEALTGMVAGPTQVMRAEHAQMTGLVERMAEALERRNDRAYLGESETLLMLMRQHNLKEEQILYPMADRAIGPDQALLDVLAGTLQPK
ncbi:MAG: hemerythrin domain-containing protein [Thiobacillaceae bacterium]